MKFINNSMNKLFMLLFEKWLQNDGFKNVDCLNTYHASTLAFWNNGFSESGPFGLISLIDEPSDLIVPSAHLFWNSSLVS